MTWGFFEIIKPEAVQSLVNYQWKTYGTKLDKPTFCWSPGVSSEDPVIKGRFPTLEEIDKEMRKPPVKQRRVV